MVNELDLDALEHECAWDDDTCPICALIAELRTCPRTWDHRPRLADLIRPKPRP